MNKQNKDQNMLKKRKSCKMWKFRLVAAACPGNFDLWRPCKSQQNKIEHKTGKTGCKKKIVKTKFGICDLRLPQVESWKKLLGKQKNTGRKF